MTGDYHKALGSVTAKSFVYFDPPYHPISEKSNFTGYIEGGWNEEDQERLKRTCDMLHNQNIKFLLSNSSSDFIKNLYKRFKIITVKANRSINSDSEKRGNIDEVLIKNYD